MSVRETAPPGRTRLSLNVGVTGHRSFSEGNLYLLRTRVREILRTGRRAAEEVVWERRSTYTEDSPVLRVVSSLAEGADRIVAEEGLSLGYSLLAPLAFPRDEYEKDFGDAASREAFRGLLARAESVFELDGSRDRPEVYYLASGRLMLNQSDLLLTIWDGEPARGVGGTAEIVREAEDRGIPVVWVDARKPHRVQRGFSGSASDFRTHLRERRITRA